MKKNISFKYPEKEKSPKSFLSSKSPPKYYQYISSQGKNKIIYDQLDKKIDYDKEFTSHIFWLMNQLYYSIRKSIINLQRTIYIDSFYKEPIFDIKTLLILLKDFFEEILNNTNPNFIMKFDSGARDIHICADGHESCGSHMYGIEILNTCGDLLNTLESQSNNNLFKKYSKQLIKLFDEVYDLYIKISEYQIDRNEEVVKYMNENKNIQN